MSGFHVAAESLGKLGSDAITELLGAVADIAIVIDADGVIRDLSLSSEELSAQDFTPWIGTPWIDTVAVDSREKVTSLLSEPTQGQGGRSLQINQRKYDGNSVMFLCNTVALEQPGSRLVVGKDLSALERMQQKLVNVQQLMERDYHRLRRYEIRYRMLFQTAEEAIIIARLDDWQIVEANPAACECFGASEKRLLSRKLSQLFDKDQRVLLDKAVASVEQTQKYASVELLAGKQHLDTTISAFKISGVTHLLLRLSPLEKTALSEAPETLNGFHSRIDQLTTLMEKIPDSLVITDAGGAVLFANSAFLDIAQLADMSRVRSQSLSNWLGHGDYDFQFMINSLKESGSVRLHGTQVRGEFGLRLDVEVSAVAFEDGERQCFGFSIRDISQRLIAANDTPVMEPGTSRTVDQLTELVGKVPLKSLVRESTEMIEQLCIEAALKMSGNNRVSAAELLGVSRQSLYVKLRRYDLDIDDDSKPN